VAIFRLKKKFATWRVNLQEDRDDTVSLRVTCADDNGRSWPVAVEVELPYDILKSIEGYSGRCVEM
jgi:hypothetical protein